MDKITTRLKRGDERGYLTSLLLKEKRKNSRSNSSDTRKIQEDEKKQKKKKLKNSILPLPYNFIVIRGKSSEKKTFGKCSSGRKNKEQKERTVE